MWRSLGLYNPEGRSNVDWRGGKGVYQAGRVRRGPNVSIGRYLQVSRHGERDGPGRDSAYSVGNELSCMQGRACDYVDGDLSQLGMTGSVESRHVTFGPDGERRASQRHGSRRTLEWARHVLLVVVSGVDAASTAGVHREGKGNGCVVLSLTAELFVLHLSGDPRSYNQVPNGHEVKRRHR